MNKSLGEGSLPKSWKEAKVTPIFKKGRRQDRNNYRPISLTSVVCKIMESIIRDHVMNHLKINDLLNACQHGFVNGRSCSTQLLMCLEVWTNIIEEGGDLDILYLDFAKAFDSVPHKRLLMKLKSLGITGNVFGWVQDFLSKRKQQVVVEDEVSSWAEVLSGVPQGSVLGPILFICFVNDMPDVVHSGIQMFADDTKIFAKVTSEKEHRQLQTDLEKLQNWSKDWQLKFNASKCKVMHVGNDNQKFNYHMKQGQENIQLEETLVEKDLGVYVDNKLNFERHIETQVNKANRILGLIRRSFDNLDEHSLPMLYKSLIRPHLEYCHAVWYPKYEKHAKLIEGVQRRATKMIPKLKNVNYDERLKLLKLPSMYYRRTRGDLIECFKYCKGLNNVEPPLHFDNQTRTRGHRFKLLKERCEKAIRKHYFSMRIVNKWNNLPSSVVNAKNINTFKNRLDKFLKSEQYELKSSI